MCWYPFDQALKRCTNNLECTNVLAAAAAPLTSLKKLRLFRLSEGNILIVKMAAPDFPDVTLAHADPALLLCWEEKVRQGVDCTVLLKHSRGKVITMLKCRKSLKSHLTAQAERK